MPRFNLTIFYRFFSLVALLCLLQGNTLNAQCSNNLLNNGGFENGNSSWDGSYTIVNDTDLNSNVVEVCNAGTNARNTITAQAGQTYTLNATAKKATGISGFIRLKFMNSSYTPIAEEFAFLTNGGYKDYTISLLAPTNAAFVEISIANDGGGSGCVRADDFCLSTGGGNPSLPDLIATNVIPSSTSAQPGGTIGANFNANNQGTTIPQSDLPFTAKMYLSLNQTIGSSDFLIGNLTLGTGSASIGGTIPAGIGAGQYYVLVEVDADNDISESDESNNVGVSNQRVTITTGTGEGDIDLNLSFAQFPVDPDQWSNFSITAFLTNEGSETATGVKVRFQKPDGVVYVGGNPFTTTQGTFDIYNTQVWNVGTIPAGATVSLKVNYFLLVDQSPVAYAQVIAANETDVDSTPNNGTPPSINEDDEASTNGGVVPNLKPDLTISSFNSPFSASSGAIVDFFFNLNNIGETTANGDYTIGVYLSDNFILDNNDILVGSIGTGNTPVGSITQVQGAASIPSSTSTGNYFLILAADIDNEIEELAEDNNSSARGINIFVSPPDPGEDFGCGYTTLISDQMTPDNNRYGYSSSETSNGIEVKARRTFFSNGNQVETTTGELNNEGDLVNIDVTVVPAVTSGQNTYEVETDADAKTVTITRFTPTGSVVWNNTFNISAPGNIAGFAGQSITTISDGTMLALNVVNTDAGTTFNLDFMKIDNQGNLLNEDFVTTVGQQIFFSELYESNNSYVWNYFSSSLNNLGFLGLDGEGNYVWNSSYTADLPSNTFAGINLSDDGNHIYVANRNNQQCFVVKYNTQTGEQVYNRNISTLFSAATDGEYQLARHFKTFILTPAEEVVVSITYRIPGGDNEYYYEWGKIDSNGDLVWVHNAVGLKFWDAISTTSDGGYLFAHVSENIFEVMKVTTNGLLTPSCDDTTPPSGNELPCDLSYTLVNGTMTIDGPGLNSGHLIVKLFDPSWNTVFSCVDNCGDPIVINDVTANGNYHFSVNTYNPNWSPICDGLVDIAVNGSSSRMIASDADLIQVYPNPASNYAQVDVSMLSEEEVSMMLIDQLGKVVSNPNIQSQDGIYEISLDKLEDGMYTIWIQRAGKKVIAKKLIVMNGK